MELSAVRSEMDMAGITAQTGGTSLARGLLSCLLPTGSRAFSQPPSFTHSLISSPTVPSIPPHTPAHLTFVNLRPTHIGLEGCISFGLQAVCGFHALGPEENFHPEFKSQLHHFKSEETSDK